MSISVYRTNYQMSILFACSGIRFGKYQCKLLRSGVVFHSLKVDIAIHYKPLTSQVLRAASLAVSLAVCIPDVCLACPQVPGRDPDATDGEVRILVHTSQAGSIIGRSGFKIKELREVGTGAALAVLPSRARFVGIFSRS